MPVTSRLSSTCTTPAALSNTKLPVDVSISFVAESAILMSPNDTFGSIKLVAVTVSKYPSFHTCVLDPILYVDVVFGNMLETILAPNVTFPDNVYFF